MNEDIPLDTRDTIDLMGAFAFALQATMSAAQRGRFKQTLELIEQQAQQQDRPAMAAALAHIVATLPRLEPPADPDTTGSTH
jgi:hypothetical protein